MSDLVIECWTAPHMHRRSLGHPFAPIRIASDDVGRLEWDGFDNIGIRTRDGRVRVVNFGAGVCAEDREPARRAILAFIERATGKPLPPPPEPPLDVTPWVVRKPPRPLA